MGRTLETGKEIRAILSKDLKIIAPVSEKGSTRVGIFS